MDKKKVSRFDVSWNTDTHKAMIGVDFGEGGGDPVRFDVDTVERLQALVVLLQTFRSVLYDAESKTLFFTGSAGEAAPANAIRSLEDISIKLEQKTDLKSK